MIRVALPLQTGRLKLEFSATFSWLERVWKRTKASKFTDAQKAFIIKQGEEGSGVAEICRKAGSARSARPPISIERSSLPYFCQPS